MSCPSCQSAGQGWSSCSLEVMGPCARRLVFCLLCLIVTRIYCVCVCVPACLCCAPDFVPHVPAGGRPHRLGSGRVIAGPMRTAISISYLSLFLCLKLTRLCAVYVCVFVSAYVRLLCCVRLTVCRMFRQVASKPPWELGIAGPMRTAFLWFSTVYVLLTRLCAVCVCLCVCLPLSVLCACRWAAKPTGFPRAHNSSAGSSRGAAAAAQTATAAAAAEQPCCCHGCCEHH